ncbi:flavin reductase [Sciscionella sediminilitoris]|uniref:flavin reductase n=1 Tax=Sciscionella sediminilitoris TaxID=1445613 RepID=UPI0004DF1245|nr:flavin reductase [Sciscionella sp. SE31]
MTRRIAIVGAGQSGAQLALGLVAHDYRVTLVNDRSPEQVRTGPVTSSQCMFASALHTERELGLDEWERSCPQIRTVSYHGESTFRAPLDLPAQSVDQRIKAAAWMERFAALGGELRIQECTAADVHEFARTHDLVVVSSGKGELGGMFAPDPARSPFAGPQRALALTYLTGAEPGAELAYHIAEGIGEVFTMPALTASGCCDILVLEGLPGGPLDHWADVRTPDEHLRRTFELLRAHFPALHERFAGTGLTDESGVLRGRLTPRVRKPVANEAAGRPVLGMADAIVLNDPITGQGSNNAAQAAAFYLENILRRGADPFDADWMRHTFERYWRGWAQWAVAWTNAMLRPAPPQVRELFTEAANTPQLARALVNGFDDPRSLQPWWFDAEEARRFIASARAERLDQRDYRTALGQYATGVAVVTTTAPDGRRLGVTANSFTSVSVDPPLVSWCAAERAPSLPGFTEASHFAVNVLAAHQHDLSRQFATRAQDKFADVELEEGIAGVPLLAGVVARFECRAVRRVPAGDHVIFLGEVERYTAPGGQPLVFHSGAYHVPTRHPDC